MGTGQPEIVVTDHALVRYLERVHGVDIEAVRAEVAALVRPAYERGMVYFQTDDLIFALSGRHVKTVMRREI